MEHAKLMVHAGGVRVTREDLVKFQTPAATATWRPASRPCGRDSCRGSETPDCRGQGRIRGAAPHPHAGGHAGPQLAHNDEFAAALAFRHANDRSEAVKLYAGVRVFACDNMAVSGDEIILKKKHTKNFDIDAAMPEAFDRYKEGTLVLQRIEALKAARLTPAEAKHSLFDIFRQRILPLRLFHPVVGDWHTATAGSEAGTAWMLHNCCTITPCSRPMARCGRRSPGTLLRAGHARHWRGARSRCECAQGQQRPRAHDGGGRAMRNGGGRAMRVRFTSIKEFVAELTQDAHLVEDGMLRPDTARDPHPAAPSGRLRGAGGRDYPSQTGRAPSAHWLGRPWGAA